MFDTIGELKDMMFHIVIYLFLNCPECGVRMDVSR